MDYRAGVQNGRTLGVSLVGPNTLIGNPQHDAHYVSIVSPEAFDAGIRVADKVCVC